MNSSPQAKLLAATALAVVVLVLAATAWATQPKAKPTAQVTIRPSPSATPVPTYTPTPTAAASATPTPTPTVATPAPPPASGPAPTATPKPVVAATQVPAPTPRYRNGTYAATGTYGTPGGSESIGVSLTVSGDVITAANVTGNAHDHTARSYQQQFISNYQPYVVGKPLSSLNLGKISGSSLTPQGFNTATGQIRSQAAN